MSVANYAEDKLLAVIFNNVSFAVASSFVQLHIGDPGENCTANPAVHTTRVASAWSAASGGALSNSGAVTFTPMAATETISYISVWDALTVGNALWYGALTTPQAVNVSGTLTFAIGAIVVTLN